MVFFVNTVYAMGARVVEEGLTDGNLDTHCPVSFDYFDGRTE